MAEAPRIVEDPDRVRWYFSNDLIKAKEQRAYRNQREHWEELYKSGCVVPIRGPNLKHRKDEDDSANYVLYGFLCIDSAKPGTFSSPYFAFNSTAMVADLLWILLEKNWEWLRDRWGTPN